MKHNFIKLNQTLGYYTPAFFKLYVNTKKPVDLHKLNVQEFTTFIHEYTHFLQDVSTLKGLQNIFNIYEWLRFFVTETAKVKCVAIPFNLSHPVLNLNQQISHISWGSNTEINKISVFTNAKVDPVTVSASILSQYPVLKSFSTVNVDAVLPDGSVKPLQIGTLAVMESMAHLTEGLMGLPVTKSPDYPYNAVRLLADHLAPSLNLSDEVLFAVCDVALQSTTPGVSLYHILHRYGNGKHPVPNDGYDVYRHCINVFDPWHDTNIMECPNIGYEHMRELVKPPMGEQFQSWVDNVSSLMLNARRTNPAFLLDEVRDKTRYVDIVNSVGTPLMVNDTEDYSKLPAKLTGTFPVKMDVEFFRALDYIVNLYFTGQTPCPLQKWCTISGLKTDSNCQHDPLRHSDLNIYHDLCPVGGLWRSWAMKDYHIQGSTISC